MRKPLVTFSRQHDSRIPLPKRERKQKEPSLVAVAVCLIDYLMPNILPTWQIDIDDTQPDEESSAQKPLNSSKPRRQAQPNRGGSVVESSTSQEPVRGDTSSKSEYHLYFLRFPAHWFSPRSTIETFLCGHGSGGRNRNATREVKEEAR